MFDQRLSYCLTTGSKPVTDTLCPQTEGEDEEQGDEEQGELVCGRGDKGGNRDQIGRYYCYITCV